MDNMVKKKQAVDVPKMVANSRRRWKLREPQLKLQRQHAGRVVLRDDSNIDTISKNKIPCCKFQTDALKLNPV
jgi:hypothetical protein